MPSDNASRLARVLDDYLDRAAAGMVPDRQSLGRRVALKILPFAGMLDPRQRQRFLNEAHAVELPRPPRKFNRALPAELETIALKALEKNPADRYRTAGDLAENYGALGI